MRRAILTLTAAAAVVVAPLALPSTAFAQKVVSSTPGKGGSPHETVEYKVGAATVTIVYGRPYLKGRSLDALAPAGKVYRTGADEATTLKTDKALQIGTLAVPAGTYTLYTLPGSPWQLIVNKQTGQWGTEYTQGQDLGRTPMTAGTLSSPAEQLTIAVVGSNLEIHWGTMKQAVAISAK
ncbi:hypothetical protein TBR22_A29570 [Luteitalea sp. TBR-22]|uniref:DUF2911 domain-containing protein n=1 Tax=Luteitalea sp. TBR-22 TaxID=2802971 RepID=UPI001AFA7887|nr:DUF2911 domain-containing protein [Luteitalea sp. TBR-22]BCS33730.1 hypothetical protein TBR22_A29570 [Luteitalea sp. TBR-22]